MKQNRSGRDCGHYGALDSIRCDADLRACCGGYRGNGNNGNGNNGNCGNGNCGNGNGNCGNGNGNCGNCGNGNGNCGNGNGNGNCGNGNCGNGNGNCGNCGNGNGNCGNCGHCGHCGHCGGHGGDCDWGYPVPAVAAQFVVTAPETEVAGGALALEFEEGDRDAFTLRGGSIRFACPGRYFASYIFQNPAGSALATTLSLNLDGRELFGSQAPATYSADANDVSFTGQALFEADEGDQLELVTGSAITVPGTTSSGPVASLFLIRIG